MDADKVDEGSKKDADEVYGWSSFFEEHRGHLLMGGLMAAGYTWNYIEEHKNLTVEQFWRWENTYTKVAARNEKRPRAVTNMPASATNSEPMLASPVDAGCPRLTYQALSKTTQQMRLLRILSSSGPDNLIDCKLVTVELHDHESYDALSYRWSQTPSKRPIRVNDTMVSVSQNLYDALSELRLRQGHSFVWVDQICINQEDQEEKQRQIILMPRIYHGAKKVIAWIGQEDESITGFARTLEDAEEYHRRKRSTQSLLFDAMCMWVEEENISSYIFSNFVRSHFVDPRLELVAILMKPEIMEQLHAIYEKKREFTLQLDAILQREYFTRAWIVQELTVAQEIAIWYGRGKTLSYRHLSSVLSELHDMGLGLFTWRHSHVFSLIQLRSRWRHNGPVRFLEAFWWGRHSISERPQDKIYSLLGVASDSEWYIASRDYNSDLSVLLLRTAENFAESTRSLDLALLRDADGSSLRGCPSWVPNLTTVGNDHQTSRVLQYLAEKYGDMPGATGAKWWTASGSREAAAPEIMYGQGIVGVRGHCLGRIITLTAAVDGQGLASYDERSTRQPDTSDERWDRSFASSVFELFTIQNEANVSIDPFDTKNFSALWSRRQLDHILPQHQQTVEWLATHVNYRLGRRRLKDWARGTLQPWNIMDRASDKLGHGVHRVAERVANGYGPGLLESIGLRDSHIAHAGFRTLQQVQRLFEATDRYIGWAHPQAKCDDYVFLLENFSVPVILRRQTHRFRNQCMFKVVGDAYVAKAMEGQEWDLDRAKMVYLM